MEMTSYMKHAEETHEAWLRIEESRRAMRDAYTHLHEVDYKMLVNLVFEFAEGLGYELTPRNPGNDKSDTL